MDLRLTVNGASATALLDDSPTAADFASLPLTVQMSDLFGREKPGQLPRALAAGGTPEHTYQVGDISYWSPPAPMSRSSTPTTGNASPIRDSSAWRGSPTASS